MSEFAPGIPTSRRKRSIPTTGHKDWKYVLHRHKARKAGEHFDLRISDGKQAYSWAIRKGIPAPGKKHLAIRQPDHTVPYMSFAGEIPEGYGAGNVTIDEAGPVRVLKSSPEKILFTVVNKRDPEELALIRTGGDNWLVINRTPTTESHKDIPLTKSKYTERQPAKIKEFIDDENYVFQPKIDGAHVLLHLRKQEPPKIYSYRPSARSNRLLNHSHKVKGLDRVNVPAEYDNTIVRAELAAIDKDNRVIPANELGALLNATTENSLEAQKLLGLKLKAYIYGKRLATLKELKKIFSDTGVAVEVPKTALTTDAKTEIFKEIEAGQRPETKEGVIAWNINESESYPIKIKIRPDFDVYVRDIFPVAVGPNKGKLAGGFRYSLTPQGKLIGNVGTGFSHALKRDMMSNPKKYIGRSAKIKALAQFPSGSLRAPSFIDWHLEKGKQPFNKTAFALGFIEKTEVYNVRNL
jgi:hypothetical protein